MELHTEARKAKTFPLRLTRDAAVTKWGRFTDNAIGGIGKPLEVRMAGLVSAGATEDKLKQFWLEVKHLSWPGTWGESPWETASYLAASLEARDLGPEFAGVGREHINAFCDAMQGHSAHAAH